MVYCGLGFWEPLIFVYGNCWFLMASFIDFLWERWEFDRMHGNLVGINACCHVLRVLGQWWRCGISHIMVMIWSWWLQTRSGIGIRVLWRCPWWGFAILVVLVVMKSFFFLSIWSSQTLFSIQPFFLLYVYHFVVPVSSIEISVNAWSHFIFISYYSLLCLVFIISNHFQTLRLF